MLQIIISFLEISDLLWNKLVKWYKSICNFFYIIVQLYDCVYELITGRIHELKSSFKCERCLNLENEKNKNFTVFSKRTKPSSFWNNLIEISGVDIFYHICAGYTMFQFSYALLEYLYFVYDTGNIWYYGVLKY